ncbi:MAG: hypothetical protein ACRBB0_13440 [Pelagimonas sp.]|uniref:hypothetical protein n=1 Tax=Pelagimonas sp. TaxID=2073170 RepID=UPI003D6AAEF6
MSRFQNKVAVVVGAEHPLGAALCKRLAGFGATVVAIGHDDTGLRGVAKHDPARIEPLALHSGWRDILRLLSEAWADQPIHIYIDVMALSSDVSSGVLSEAFACSTGLTAALRSGLEAGKALGVVAVPTDVDTTKVHGPKSSYRALLKRFSNGADPIRMLGVGLPGRDHHWAPQGLVSATDTVLMLCHPVSRGVKSGMVIDWTPDLR